jgi:hypothetical protein
VRHGVEGHQQLEAEQSRQQVGVDRCPSGASAENGRGSV